jgi:rhodanese-related sulfurtransferase
MPTKLLAVMLLAASPALAADIEVVGADEVHALAVRGNGLLVDARSPREFAQAHILGAVNIPAERTRAEAARLPRHKDTPIVFYCRGVG